MRVTLPRRPTAVDAGPRLPESLARGGGRPAAGYGPNCAHGEFCPDRGPFRPPTRPANPPPTPQRRPPPADLALLGATEEIEIETRAAPDAPVHRTIIWIMTDGNDAFVRSVRGGRGRWYREAIANPQVAVHAGGRRLAARVVAANDPTSI